MQTVHRGLLGRGAGGAKTSRGAFFPSHAVPEPSSVRLQPGAWLSGTGVLQATGLEGEARTRGRVRVWQGRCDSSSSGGFKGGWVLASWQGPPAAQG